MELFVLLVADNARTTDSTSSSGGNQTDLLTWTGVTSHSTWLTNMLMVTTTVWMLDWILGDTSNLWPAITLHSKLVVGTASFQHWLVDSSAAGDQTQRGTVSAGVQLLDAGWELDSGSAGVWVVGHDGAVAAGGLGDLAAVTGLLLQGAHDRTFWHLADWHDVTDAELGLLTAVHKLAGA